MKQFTPDKYLGHKLGRIHRNIDRYFDRPMSAEDTGNDNRLSYG